MPLPAPIAPSASEEALVRALVSAYRDAATDDQKSRAYVMLAKFVHVRPLAEKRGYIEVLRVAQAQTGDWSLKQDARYQELLALAPDERAQA